jgi:hypothetical protein
VFEFGQPCLNRCRNLPYLSYVVVSGRAMRLDNIVREFNRVVLQFSFDLRTDRKKIQGPAGKTGGF